MQKTFIADHISKRSAVNDGELPQYYIENNHTAIINRDTFQKMQDEIKRRLKMYDRKSAPQQTYKFTSKIKCEQCGKNYRRKILSSGKVVWICSTFNRPGKAYCPSQQISEEILKRVIGDTEYCEIRIPCHLAADEIKNAFIGAFNSCIKNRKEIIDNCVTAISTVMDSSKLEKQAAELTEECTVVTKLIRKCVDENAHISIDPKVYAEKYELLADRYTKAKDKLDETETKIANTNSRKNMIATFLDELEKQEHLITVPVFGMR